MTFLTRLATLFKPDPRWRDGIVLEAERDPRVRRLFARLAAARPIAQTADRRMRVCVDPETNRGWLVTEWDVSAAGTTRDLKPLDEARVTELRTRPELLEGYKACGRWEASPSL